VLINGGRIALEADLAELVRERSLEEEYLRHVTGEAPAPSSDAAPAPAPTEAAGA